MMRALTLSAALIAGALLMAAPASAQNDAAIAQVLLAHDSLQDATRALIDALRRQRQQEDQWRRQQQATAPASHGGFKSYAKRYALAGRR